MNSCQVEAVVCGAMWEYCYVVSLAGRKDCVVIDPGAQPEKILAAVKGREISAILLTHCHFDHVGAVEALLGARTPLVIHRADAPGLGDPYINASALMAAPRCFPAASRLVDGGEVLSYAGMEFEVLHTPGHTAGSVCYRCGEELFTGDTLLQGTHGRTDLPTGSDAEMYRSLTRLLPLARGLRCHGGH